MNLVDDDVRERAEVDRARLVSIKCNDSGVVIRMSGGLRSSRLAIFRRCVAGPDGDRQARASGEPGRLRRFQDPFERNLEVADRCRCSAPSAAKYRGCGRPGRSLRISPEMIEAGQEGRQGLARTRRRERGACSPLRRSPAIPAVAGGVGSPKPPETSSRHGREQEIPVRHQSRTINGDFHLATARMAADRSYCDRIENGSWQGETEQMS